MHFNPSSPSNALIQQNPFALSNPFHSYPHTVASQASLSAVSIISTRLVDFVVKRGECLPYELDNPTLRYAGSTYHIAWLRITLRANIGGRATINLAYVSGREQLKSKAITHRLTLSLSLSLVSGKSACRCRMSAT